MTAVEIEYCVPCGHLDRAIDVQREILSDLADQLDSVTLVTGDGGDFIVRVDGETIYDKAEAETAFDVEQIKDEIGTRATA
jgi:selenoprotein W-related protein